jgi:hypothetical protein
MTKRGEWMQTQHFTHKYTPATQWAAQSEAQFQVSSLAEAHAAIFQCFRVRLTLLSVVASCGVGSCIHNYNMQVVWELPRKTALVPRNSIELHQGLGHA